MMTSNREMLKRWKRKMRNERVTRLDPTMTLFRRTMEFFFSEGVGEYFNHHQVNPREWAMTAALGATLVRMAIESQNLDDPIEGDAFLSGCVYLGAGKCEGQTEFVWNQLLSEGLLPPTPRYTLARTLLDHPQEALTALKFVMTLDLPAEIIIARDRDVICALVPGSGFPISEEERSELLTHLREVGFTPLPRNRKEFEAALEGRTLMRTQTGRRQWDRA